MLVFLQLFFGLLYSWGSSKPFSMLCLCFTESFFPLQDYVHFPHVWMLATWLFLLAVSRGLHCCIMLWIITYIVRLWHIFFVLNSVVVQLNEIALLLQYKLVHLILELLCRATRTS